jgi:hypothetical protein
MEALSHPMAHFIGAKVAMALNYYSYNMHELCKVNEIKFFL